MFLFQLVVDYIMSRTKEREPTGIRWNFTTKLEDLEFANDLSLLSSKYQDKQRCMIILIGLKINNIKTKVMRLNSNIKTPVKINEEETEDVDTYKYLGGVVTSTGV